MSLRAAAFALVLLGALGPVPAMATDYQYWYAFPQQKVYQDTPAPAVRGTASRTETPTLGIMTVRAARAEHEGRQLVIRPTDGQMRNVWIEPSDLAMRDASGTVVDTIPARSVSVSKVHYVYVSKPSYGYGRVGWEPDALLPMTLANGEKLGWRKGVLPDAAPRSVAASATQPFYVLFQVPDSAAPGVYRGTITVTAEDEAGEPFPVVRVPVRLTVYPFSIAERTLKTSFGMSLRWAKYANSDRRTWLPRLARVAPGSDRVAERTIFSADQIGGWLKYMSDHRVSPQTLLPAWETGSSWAPPADDGTMQAREAYLEDYLGTGAATTFDGERFGFNTVRMPEHETRPSYITDPFSSLAAQDAATLYYRTMREQLGSWADKAYVYAIDEPTSTQRPFVERYGYFIRRYLPGSKFLVTIEPAPFGYKPLYNVDIYVHKLHFFYRDHKRWVVPLRQRGKDVWIYSHMGIQQGGSPMYLIDKPLADSRVQGWFAYHTKAGGLLYYSVNRWTAPVKGSSVYRDPYADPLSLSSSWAGKPVHSNGDGSLVYPGYYPALGLNVQGAPPVGSLRMEALRDGLEDYEYLKLLQTATGTAAGTDPFVRKVIGPPATVVCWGRKTFPWYPKTHHTFEVTRDAVALALTEALAAQETSGTVAAAGVRSALAR